MNDPDRSGGHPRASAVGGLAVGFVARGIVATSRSRPPRTRPGASSRRRATQQKDSSSRPRTSRSASSARPRRRRAPSAPTSATSSAGCCSATSSSTSARTCSRSATASCMVKEQELERQRERARPGPPGADRRPRAGQRHVASTRPSQHPPGAGPRRGRARRRPARPRHRALGRARTPRSKARDVVVTAIQRVMVDHTAEMTVSVVPIPSDEMKGRIIGREGRNIRALEQATGIDLIIDDTPESVLISGFDPVRREIARLALTKLIQDGRIHPGRIEEVVAKAKRRGRPAHPPGRRGGRLRRPACPGLPPEIIKLLGRLQLPHQLRPERAQARDGDRAPRRGHRGRGRRGRATIAKMGGLLHDIGKAVDHEVEGPHAAIGAQIAASAQPARRRSSTASPRITRRSSTPASRRRSSRSPTPSARRGPGARGEIDGHVRQAARGPPGDRQQLRRRREVLRGPGRARGAHPRPARGDRRPRLDAASRATSCARSRRR